LAPDRHAADLVGIELADGQGRAGDGRRQQEIVALEERARVLPPGEPIEPRLDVLRRRDLRGLLDDREQSRVDLVAAVEIGRRARGDAAQEDRAPAIDGRGPRGLDWFDLATELAEGAGGLRGRGARLGIDRGRDAKRRAPRDAWCLEAPLQRL